jgi:hypothetical protein
MKILWTSMLILAGCSSPKDQPGLVKARLFTSTPSGYQLETVSFSTLESAGSLSSPLLELRGKAVLSIDDDIEERISSENPEKFYSSRGGIVRTDYLLKNSVVYPKTFSDMANLAIFYNFELTYSYWVKNLGLNTAGFGRTTIYNNPTIKFSSDQVIGSIEPKFNASFVQGLRDFWFFKESTKADIPIKMNLAVLAHEFTHSIFDLYFAEKKVDFYTMPRKDSDDIKIDTTYGIDYDNDFLLSGINEGLADFFSWLVTGRASELGASIASMAQTRVPPVNFKLSTYRFDCGDSFYCLGSLLNSALFEIANAPDGVERIQLGKYILLALQSFRQDWIAEKSDTSNAFTMDMDKFVERIVAEEPNADKRTKMCTIFKSWFDSMQGQICD